MDEVVFCSYVLSCDGASARLPVVHMVRNQTSPVGDKPSLMTFRGVSDRWIISFCSLYLSRTHVYEFSLLIN